VVLVAGVAGLVAVAVLTAVASGAGVVLVAGVAGLVAVAVLTAVASGAGVVLVAGVAGLVAVGAGVVGAAGLVAVGAGVVGAAGLVAVGAGAVADGVLLACATACEAVAVTGVEGAVPALGGLTAAGPRATAWPGTNRIDSSVVATTIHAILDRERTRTSITMFPGSWRNLSKPFGWLILSSPGGTGREVSCRRCWGVGGFASGSPAAA
jgi:hypothetical protein